MHRYTPKRICTRNSAPHRARMKRSTAPHRATMKRSTVESPETQLRDRTHRIATQLNASQQKAAKSSAVRHSGTQLDTGNILIFSSTLAPPTTERSTACHLPSTQLEGGIQENPTTNQRRTESLHNSTQDSKHQQNAARLETPQLDSTHT